MSIPLKRNGRPLADLPAFTLSPSTTMKTMFLAELKLAVGAVTVALALGAGGVAYQVAGPRAAQAAPERKPLANGRRCGKGTSY